MSAAITMRQAPLSRYFGGRSAFVTFFDVFFSETIDAGLTSSSSLLTVTYMYKLARFHHVVMSYHSNRRATCRFLSVGECGGHSEVLPRS